MIISGKPDISACGDALSPEERALLILSRQYLGDRDISDLNYLVSGGLVYRDLAELAMRHGVAPMVGFHLQHDQRMREQVRLTDFEFIAAMVATCMRSQVHKDMLYRELDDLQRVFDAHEVKFVALKGPGMALDVYEHPDMRSFSDLDLLLDPRDMLTAHAILTKAGYTPKDGADEEQILARTNARYHGIPYVKRGQAGQIVVEPHVFGRRDGFFFEQEYAYARKRQLRGQHVWVPSMVDYFLHSCHHLITHQSKSIYGMRDTHLKLRHLMDVRESYLALKKAGLEEDLKERVNSPQLMRLVAEGVLATEKIYGAFFDWFFDYPDRLKRYFSISLDWEGYDWSLPFSERLLRPGAQFDRLMDGYRNSRETATTSTSISRMSRDELTNWWENSEFQFIRPLAKEKEQYWGTIARGAVMDGEEIGAKLAMRWDEAFLYFHIEITDHCLIFVPEEDGLGQDSCSLWFAPKIGDYPYSIGIEPQKEGAHRVTSRHFTDQGSISDEISGLDLEITVDQHGYVVDLALPWELTGIDPQRDKHFLLDVIVNDVNPVR